MAGLQAGTQAGFRPIKLTMVVMRGVNDHEISRMAKFCFEQGFILRLIEAMPIGHTGQNSAYMDIGPARYWMTRDGASTLGFITPMSQHFCASCNRVRLAVDGTLYMCLGQDEKFELLLLLPAGISDNELEAAIRIAIDLKPERHEFNTQSTKIIRFMSQTGG